MAHIHLPSAFGFDITIADPAMNTTFSKVRNDEFCINDDEFCIKMMKIVLGHCRPMSSIFV